MNHSVKVLQLSDLPSEQGDAIQALLKAGWTLLAVDRGFAYLVHR